MIYWERVFFILLADTSQEVINTEMQDAYEDFVKQIVTISHSEDYTHVFRMLNLTRIEIAGGEIRLKIYTFIKHYP